MSSGPSRLPVFPISGSDLKAWTELARRGGLGIGTAKRDHIALNSAELMYFLGDRIVILDAGQEQRPSRYLAFCQGSVGFVSVRDVELDSPLGVMPLPLPGAPPTAPQPANPCALPSPDRARKASSHPLDADPDPDHVVVCVAQRKTVPSKVRSADHIGRLSATPRSPPRPGTAGGTSATPVRPNLPPSWTPRTDSLPTRIPPRPSLVAPLTPSAPLIPSAPLTPAVSSASGQPWGPLPSSTWSASGFSLPISPATRATAKQSPPASNASRAVLTPMAPSELGLAPSKAPSKSRRLKKSAISTPTLQLHTNPIVQRSTGIPITPHTAFFDPKPDHAEVLSVPGPPATLPRHTGTRSASLSSVSLQLIEDLSTFLPVSTPVTPSHIPLPMELPVGRDDYIPEEVIVKGGPAFEMVKPHLHRVHQATRSEESGTGLSEDQPDPTTKRFPNPETMVEKAATFISFPDREQSEWYRTRESFWLGLISSSNSSSERIRQSKKVRKWMRLGVPQSLRGKVWGFTLGVNEFKVTGLFEKLVDQKRPGFEGVYDIIEADLARCVAVGEHALFGDGHMTMVSNLRSLLRAFMHYSADRIEPGDRRYSPDLGTVAGFLLVHSPIEEAFWNLVGIVRRHALGYWFDKADLDVLKTTAAVFDGILEELDPVLARHLAHHQVHAQTYISSHFSQLFITTLPWPTLVRAMDLFISEGEEILYRLGITMVMDHRTKILKLIWRQHIEQILKSSQDIDLAKATGLVKISKAILRQQKRLKSCRER